MYQIVTLFDSENLSSSGPSWRKPENINIYWRSLIWFTAYVYISLPKEKLNGGLLTSADTFRRFGQNPLGKTIVKERVTCSIATPQSENTRIKSFP